MTPQIAFLINQALQSLSSGNFKTAELYLSQALKIGPKNTHVLRFLGVVSAQQKQWEKAGEFFKKSINADPKNAIAYSNLGNVFLELEKYEEAIPYYDKAIALEPTYAEAWSNKGNALSDLKKYEEAIPYYDKAIALEPTYAEAWSNKGNALTKLRHFNEALDLYAHAISLNSLYAEAWCNKGACLGAMQAYEDALLHINETLKLKPNYPEAWLVMGQIYGDQGFHGQSLKNYQTAYEIDPTINFVYGFIVHLKALIGNWSSYKADLDQLLMKLGSKEKVMPPMGLLSITDDPQIQLKAAQIYCNSEYPKNDSLGPIPKYSHPKIKVAYFSADFKDHPVAYLTAELFELHDREHFEIYAFSTRKSGPSPIRDRLINAFDHFIEVDEQSDKEVALLARELQIDIAVDLGGHTQHARTGIFAYRAAPVQVNYLGFAGTMGADYFDYIVADKIVIPQEFQEFYLEKKVYLPNSYIVDDSQRAPSNKKLSRSEFGLPEDSTVFCCFNNSYKFNPPRIASFAKILTNVPNSVMWITENNASFKQNLLAEFNKLGIAEHRIVFATRVDAMADHLARYRLADLFLDTSPYNAHTTAMDSLKSGLPIISLAGKSFASRVGASLLTAIGLPELIVQSEEEFIDLASKLGQDARALQLLKEKLSQNLTSTALFNTKIFCGHLEAAYQEMHQAYMQDLAPADIYINQ
jgi:predicted O-linked N-acetylglucosamine transferase (SPINDLY family)